MQTSRYILLFVAFIAQFNWESAVLAQHDAEQSGDLLSQWFNAATDGTIETIKQLIVKVNVNAQDEIGQTALMIAAAKGHEDIVELLLTAPGIDINVEVTGFNALQYAVDSFGRQNIVKLLLAFPGINVNVQDYFLGKTPLISAVRRYDENVVKLLLENKNININAQTKMGETALMSAVQNLFDNENIVSILLQSPHININTQDNCGRTAYIMAKESNRPRIAQCIQDKIEELTRKAFELISARSSLLELEKTGKAMADTKRQHNLDKLKSVIAQIGDNLVDNNGHTLLDKAFSAQAHEIIFFLLQNAKNPLELLARFPFEYISPTSDIFKYFFELAYRKICANSDCHNGQIDCTKRCSNCKKVFYCSAACQKQDWKRHRHNCG